jgi:exosortase
MIQATRSVQFLAFGCVVCAAGLLYWPIGVDLTRLWLNDDDYSHALILLGAIAFFTWTRRDRLRAADWRPSHHGLWIVVGSMGILLVGTAGVEYFLQRVSVLGTVAGMIVFLAGWAWLRVLLFPLFLAALVIPIPPVLFFQVTFPLQLLASRFGVTVLELVGIPVFREGNIIALAHTTLEVTEACSGIRSLLSLFALSVLYSYWTHAHNGLRLLVVLSSIPIAIVCNGLRVAGTGMAAHYIDASAASGFFHGFSGWAMFMTAVVMLLGVSGGLKLIRRGSVQTQVTP